MDIKEVKKILFFRLCCIGDVTMLTPVINNLHRQFPNAEIVIAASGWIDSLLPYLTHINRSIVFEAPFRKNIFSKISGTLKFIFRLRKEKFGLAFLAHRNSIYGLILKLAGIPFRFGFEETKFLTHVVKYDHSAHFVDRHLNILSSNGINAPEKNLTLNPVIEKNEVKKKYNITPGRKIIGIFPFGGSNPGTIMKIKRWGNENFITLARKIVTENKDISVLLFEGFLDDEKFSDKPQNGNLKVMQINIDLISACDLFISGDTGPLYIAEGFGISTLSIFGPSDSCKVAPKSKLNGVIHTNIYKKIHCSPCYTSETAIRRNDPKYWDGNTFICHTGTHDCMILIQVDEVYNTAMEMIKQLEKFNKS